MEDVLDAGVTRLFLFGLSGVKNDVPGGGQDCGRELPGGSGGGKQVGRPSSPSLINHLVLLHFMSFPVRFLSVLFLACWVTTFERWETLV